MSEVRTNGDWFQRTSGSEVRGRLFCFAFAGGSAGVFRGWSRGLANVELVAVQLPGRENRHREKAFVSMPDLIAELMDAMRPIVDLPFAFFGYSLGSLIAFEAARALRRAGLSMPRRLFAAASPPPQQDHARNPLVHRLNDVDLISEMRRFGGTPDVVLANRELLSLLLPVIRADFELLETYRCEPEPPLDLPITALGGIDDAEVAPHELAEWSEQTSAGFNLRFFPGDHFFLKTSLEQLLAVVAQELQSTFPSVRRA